MSEFFEVLNKIYVTIKLTPKTIKNKHEFQSFMVDGYNALISIQADQAEKPLDVRIENKNQKMGRNLFLII